MQLTDRTLARSCTFKLVQGVLQEEQDGPALAPTRTLAAGTIIDSKFRIVGLLGEGGMGAVYRASHLTLGNEVALKTFRTPDLSPSAWERFQREVKSIAMLENKNIVRVFDSGIDQTNVPYYTMELLTGESLAQRIRREGPLPLRETMAIFMAVAEALVSAHAKGIVHRDLKPENIFLVLKDNKIESTKLVDFGIAKLTDGSESDSQRLTRAGTIFGSPLYMSPEQSLGEETDARSDIYSYGCAFYEALTGRPPFVGKTAFATILSHQTEVAARIDECAPDRKFPSWLPALVASMLAKKKEKRLQNVQEILDVFSFQRMQERKSSKSGMEKMEAARPQTQTSTTGSGRASKTKLLVVSLVLLGGALIIASAYGFKQFIAHRAAQAEAEIAGSSGETKAALVPPPPIKTKGGERFFKGTRMTPKGLIKVFKFASKQSMGALIPESGVGYVDCIGNVEVPANVHYTLVPDAVVFGQGFWMDGFVADDLWGIKYDPKILNAYNWTDGHIDAIAHLTGLVLLNVRNTEVSGASIPAIGKLSGLRQLDVTQSRITGQDLTHLANLNSLTDLIAARTDGISDFLRTAATSKLNLERLNLKKCNLHDGDLEQIAKIKTLRGLMLDENPITDAGIKHLVAMPNLQVLQLSRTDLGPAAVDVLCRIKTLVNLTVPAQSAGAEQMQKFKERLPHCNIQISQAFRL